MNDFTTVITVFIACITYILISNGLRVRKLKRDYDRRRLQDTDNK